MKIPLLLAFSLLTGLCSVAHAEDHALIINLSHYSDPRANLVGIDSDIPLMKEVLGKLSFKPTQIKTLSNAQATRNGILEGVSGWLIAGVKPGDRVVLYYNGHGGRVKNLSGDEADGCDEVLFGYDLDHPILENELQGLIKRIPAEQILVILDSGFSGTVPPTREFKESAIQSKFFRSETQACPQAENDPAPHGSRRTPTLALERNRPYLLLSAAAEQEVAWGSVLRNKPGSLFTVALHTRIVDTPGPVSFEQLHDYTARFVAEISSLAGIPPSHPQLSGPTEWLNQDITAFGKLTSPDTAVTASSEARQYPPLLVQIPFGGSLPGRARFRVDHPVRCEASREPSWDLRLLELDAAGSLTSRFLDAFDHDPAVEASPPLNLPSRAFRLEISAPQGTLMAGHDHAAVPEALERERQAAQARRRLCRGKFGSGTARAPPPGQAVPAALSAPKEPLELCVRFWTVSLA